MSEPEKSNGPSAAVTKQFNSSPGISNKFRENFGVNRAFTAAVIAFCGLVIAGAVFFFIHSAPPDTITISSGPEGSSFYSNAVKYATCLARQGIKLKILTSEGSFENLERLENATNKVDVGFVQGGVTNETMNKLVSLGSIAYEPLLIFYRGATVDTLSGLAGKRLAIGPVGSGTRTLVLSLLGANGISPGGATAFVDWEPAKSSQGLLDGTVDGIFLMSEDASTAILRELLRSTNVHLFNFTQAEAYTRRFNFLSTLKLPQGAIDLGKNIPAQDVYLVGPTVELVARKGLHPALSDVLLEAAQEVHGKASLLQHKGEFPAPIQHDLPISADAARFYKSGASFFYHYLPFWLASLTSRIVVVFIPMVVVLFPIIKSIPHFYIWRINRQYRALIVLERELSREPDAEKRRSLLKRLDEIERTVNKMKVPTFVANLYYSLRQHIDFVRLMNNNPAAH